ncbi:unnamed protein product [Caenorhabditis nigoni]
MIAQISLSYFASKASENLIQKLRIQNILLPGNQKVPVIFLNIIFLKTSRNLLNGLVFRILSIYSSDIPCSYVRVVFEDGKWIPKWNYAKLSKFWTSPIFLAVDSAWSWMTKMLSSTQSSMDLWRWKECQTSLGKYYEILVDNRGTKKKITERKKNHGTKNHGTKKSRNEIKSRNEKKITERIFFSSISLSLM